MIERNSIKAKAFAVILVGSLSLVEPSQATGAPSPGESYGCFPSCVEGIAATQCPKDQAPFCEHNSWDCPAYENAKVACGYVT